VLKESAMSEYVQEQRAIAIDTPLGKDVLLLTSFKGKEELSRLFKCDLEMVSEKDSISAKDIVGKNVTITLKEGDQVARFFNGFVSRFSYCGTEDRLSKYVAEVVPWLWFLTLTSDCRIFQKKSVPKIIEQIFKDQGFSEYEISQVKGTHPDWDYCVQYRETDFNFVSRLMEQEGIFYFFRHENGKHTLVLADQKGAYEDCKENEVECSSSLSGAESTDHVTSWHHQYEFRPGKWAQTDYNFETPTANLMAKTNTIVSLDGVNRYEIYDYPGEYEKKNEGEAYVKIRMEEVEASHDVVQAAGKCRTFFPGGKFKVKKHQSRAEEGKTYVIVSIQHSTSVSGSYLTSAGAGEEYGNTFTCIPDSVTFRPARLSLKPVVHGSQTAVVVGPAGEEIYTDKFGRVKVQFHWDREGKRDENSSCWIRVSHPWAGKGWGAVSIPRIGQEVIVDFLEGDPDRPIIIGRVYNADVMPPYPLPDQAMVSGVKSDSTPGGGGSNEMSMDDTKGKEKVTVHSQFDMSTTVENDQTNTVHNNRSTSVDVDDSQTVGSNQKQDIGAKQTVTVGSDQSITVGAAHTLKVAAAQNVEVGSSQKVTVAAGQDVTVGAARKVGVSASDDLTVGGAQTISVTGPISISSSASIELKVGGSSIKITPGSIDINSSGPVTITGAVVKNNG
jgi:type VI secretion system secreted protein VgrG